MDEALKVATERFKNLGFKNKIKIKYLTRTYLVIPRTGEVTYFNTPSKGGAGRGYLEKEGQVSKREKIIILHYLIAAKEIPLSGKLIDFRDVPSGNMYYSVFEARVCQPFLKFFGKNPSLFIKAAEAVQGEKVDFGDIAFKFAALPRIPINFILYKGDEEFPPACKVLFDSSIFDYLPTEDIAIVCEDLVMKLKNLSSFDF